MATYKELKGTQIPVLSSDPTLVSDMEGEVWFNSTTNELKGLVGIAAWGSSSNMIHNTSYGQTGGNAMTQSSMLCMGRYTPGPTTTFNTVQLYNGSGWSEETGMNTIRYSGQGGGSSTAAIIAGGVPSTTNTETFDGTTWTEVANNIPTNHIYGTGAGTQTAFYAGGGNAGVPVEEYDGTSWTAGGSLNNPRTGQNWGVGTLTAGLAAGGEPYAPKVSEEYDGTTWTIGGTANTQHGYAQGAGIQTNALMIGGHEPSPTRLTEVEAYDGTAWTVSSNLATGRSALQGGGSSSSAVVGGGDTPSATNVTEEYNVSINILTAAAWASGNAPANARQWASGMGTSTAGLMYGGVPRASPTPMTEEYDGSSWTAGGAYPVTYMQNGGGAGTQTAGLGWGGWTNAPPYDITSTNTYDGSTWTASPATMGNARYQFSSAGSATAALMAGGAKATPPATTLQDTEEFNGTAWVSGGSLNTGTQTGAGGPQGSQTDALIAGGNPPASSQTETYNGTAWTTSGATLIEAGSGQAASGTSSSPMLFAGNAPGGNPPYAVATCQEFDGSAWATSPSLGTVAAAAAGMGTPSEMVIAGGRNAAASPVAQTQTFTGVTETATASVISSS